MSEARVIACNNCGSRYKLPPTFQGSKVRCKNCGAVIEIESSLVSPAAPAAAKPKAASPKTAAPKPPATPAAKRASKRSASAAEPKAAGRRSSSARRGSKVSGSRSTRGRRAAAEEEEEEEAPARGGRRGARGGSRASSRSHGRSSGGARRGARGRRGEEEVEEKSKTPMMLGIGGGVLVLAIALFFLLKGGDQKPVDPGQGNQVAKTDGTAGQEATNPNLPPEEGSGTDEKVAKKDEAGTGKAEEAAAKGEGKTKEAAAKKPAKKPAKKTAKKPKKKLAPGESSTPFDPMTETEALAWAEDVTDEEKKEITDLVETAFSDDSIFGKRAATKLEKHARKAFSAIVNRLRSVDYSDHDQHLEAYGLHKLLEKITMGRNAGYNPKVPVTQGAAWWNARTVKGWMRFWNNQVNEGDPAAWKEFMRKRKAKQKSDDSDF